MRTENKVLVPGTSMASTITGSPQIIDNMGGFCVQAVYTGTPTGTLKLQCSCDYAGDQSQSSLVSNWTDIPSQTASLSGSAGSTLFNVPDSFYRWIRVVYTAGSGSGNLTATINAKGF